MNEKTKIVMEMMTILTELDRAQTRGALMLDAKKAEFLLACEEGNDSKIEETRQACVDVFSACLDEMVKLNKQVSAIKKKVMSL
jgi:hypothetical protein